MTEDKLANVSFTFTSDLLAALRREGMAAEMVNMLAARGTVSLDSLMEEVDRGELAFGDAISMAYTAAYFAEQDRAFTAHFGDLDNWKPTGFLGVAGVTGPVDPPPAPALAGSAEGADRLRAEMEDLESEPSREET